MCPEKLDKLMKLVKESDSRSKKKAIKFRISNLNELTKLLNNLRITDRFAETKYGDYWTVNAHPFPGRDDEHTDILLQVQTNDPANQSLTVGLPFMLQNDKGNFWLSTGITDDCGRTWFRNLPVGSYHARLDNKVLLSALIPDQQEYRVAAAPVEDDLITIYLEDPRVYVYLERGDEAEAVLSVYAESPEYEKAIVFYEIGDESGKLVLEPTGAGNRWRAVRYLSQSFADIKESVPQIKVCPLEKQ